MKKIMTTGSDLLADELYNFGVRVAFVFTGGAISAIIDSVARRGIEIIPYDHELDASYAAEGYIRATSKPTVVLVTSGPGATNTITGVIGSWLDSIPVIYIYGQVKSFEKTNFELCLQNGFQETNIIKTTSHFVKYIKAIDHCSQITSAVREMFESILKGRPGPAILDVTMDAQTEKIEQNKIHYDYWNFSKSLSMGISKKKQMSQNKDFDFILSKIIKSANPVILIGGGAQWLPKGLLDKIIRKLKVITISTYPAINAINYKNKFYFGMIGPFGHPIANKALIDASDIFIFGARIPQRAFPILSEQTKQKLHSSNKYVITLEPSEFVNHKIGPIKKIINGHIYEFLNYINKKVPIVKLNHIKNSIKSNSLPDNIFQAIKSQSDQAFSIKKTHSVSDLLDSLNNHLPKNSNIFVDTGQNAVALALGLSRINGERLFSSWSNSPMGFSLPAALGASIGDNKKKSVCIIGDGGIRTALSSLPNLRKLKGKVKLILWDNQGYRCIVDHIEKMLSGRRNAVTVESGIPYFPIEKVLKSCDLNVLNSKNLDDDMKVFFTDDSLDVLIVPVDPSIRMIANKII